MAPRTAAGAAVWTATLTHRPSGRAENWATGTSVHPQHPQGSMMDSRSSGHAKTMANRATLAAASLLSRTSASKRGVLGPPAEARHHSSGDSSLNKRQAGLVLGYACAARVIARR